MREPTSDEATAFLEDADFIWHQHFELGGGVMTPGVDSSVAFLHTLHGLPDDCTGMSILDIGTTNGGLAFDLCRRGADVTAVDIYDADWFGFDRMREFLDASIPFVKGSVYELPGLLDGATFDVVIFFGVLYHLRHPLLALDNLRHLCRDGGQLMLETQVCDGDEGDRPGIVKYFRGGELNNDPSNWFVPTSSTVVDMVESSGFAISWSDAWPAEHPTRCGVRAVAQPGAPEFQRISYEVPLSGVPIETAGR